MGHIENISISGAFVRTARSLPVWIRVEVEMSLPGEPGRRLERVAAHVIRRARDGVGVEWYELAPRAVRAVLPRTDALSVERPAGAVAPAAAIQA